MSIRDEIAYVVAQRQAGDKQRERLFLQELGKQFTAEDIRALGMSFTHDHLGHCARFSYEAVSFLVRVGEWQWTQPEGIPRTWTVETTVTYPNGQIESMVEEGIALSQLRRYIRDTAIDAAVRACRV